MTRFFAASLLLALVAVLLATPALALGPVERNLKVGYALDSKFLHDDADGCLAME